MTTLPRLRLAVLSYGLPTRAHKRGGIERAAHTLADALARRGHEVVVLSHDPRPADAAYAVAPLPWRTFVETWFGRRVWGTGGTRESKALDAHLAVAVLGRQRRGSYSNPDNLRSTRALLGVGFTHEGVLRHWHRHGENYYDVNVFGMLRSDWDNGPLADVPVMVEGQPPPAFVVGAP